MTVSFGENCRKFTYLYKTTPINRTCFFCKLSSDLTAGAITNNLKIVKMTLPATKDLNIIDFYNGLSSNTGKELLSSKTPVSTINERLGGDYVLDFQIIEGANLNRNMEGQVIIFKLKTSSYLSPTHVILLKV
jgi:hypothetical protein